MGKEQTDDIIMLSPTELVSMADDWYEYATPDHFWMNSRFLVLKSMGIVGQWDGKRLLEIGCGNGVIIEQIESQTNIIVDGCDLNLAAMKLARKSQGQLYCLNIFDQPKELEKSYDGILLMDVIEHIEDHVLFLKTALTYLRPGCHVIINVPALNVLFSNYDVIAGHKRRYNKKMVQDLFRACDLELVEIRYWGFFLLPLAWTRKLILKFKKGEDVIKTGFKPPGKFINWLLQKTMDLENKILTNPPLGTSLIAVAKISNS